MLTPKTTLVKTIWSRVQCITHQCYKCCLYICPRAGHLKALLAKPDAWTSFLTGYTVWEQQQIDSTTDKVVMQVCYIFCKKDTQFAIYTYRIKEALKSRPSQLSWKHPYLVSHNQFATNTVVIFSLNIYIASLLKDLVRINR